MRKAVVVLGMHRSGTSAVTRVISLLGADLPKSLMQPWADNETGFWESKELQEIHDAMLASAGSSWDDVLPIAPAWFASAPAADFRGQVLAVLERDFGASDWFVIKDPRACRLVPFWLDVLREFGAHCSFVLSVRNPLEVAASLTKRDGFSMAKSLALWLRHMLEAERGSRGHPRAIVRYAELLADWRSTASRLANELDFVFAPSRETAAEVDGFLSPPLRHHRFAAAELATRPELARWVLDCFEALDRAEPDQPRLDAIARALAEADRLWAPLVAEQRKLLDEERRSHQQQRELTEQERARADDARSRTESVGVEIASVRAELAAAQGELASTRGELASAHGELASARREVGSLRGALVAERAQAERLRGDLAYAHGELQARDADRGALRAALTEKESTIARLASEAAAVNAQLAERGWQIERLAKALATVTTSVSWRMTVPLRRARSALQRLRRRRRSAVSPLLELPPTDFVEALYRGVLGRATDDEGRRRHVALLQGSMSREEIIDAFAGSREFRSRLQDALRGREATTVSDDEFVTGVYVALLRREPSAEELVERAAALRRGARRTDLVVDLVHSREFYDRHLHAPPIRPALERIVAVDDQSVFLVGRVTADERNGLQEALRGAGVDGLPAVHWLPNGSDAEPAGRFVASLSVDAAQASGVALDVGANGAAPPGGGSRVADPFEGRRVVLESLPADPCATSTWEYVHPVIERLTDRCHASVGVRRRLTLGTPPAAADVSIVIPLYRRIDLVEQQLAQFADDPDLAAAELIYVLDSPEQERELELAAHQLFQLYRLPLRILVLERNVGYSAATNVGAAAANGRLLVLLNSDVFPSRAGWLRTMIDFYDSKPTMGALGPKLLYEDDSVQHAGVYFTLGHEPSGAWGNLHYFKGLPRHYPLADVTRPVPAVTGACLMISRALFEQVGRLRESYVHGTFEDSDLCLACLQAGHENWYLAEVEMYHLERQSFRELDSRWLRNAYTYNCWLQTKLWGDRIADVMRSLDDEAV
jgi:GT2 family glycosyltransferase